MKSTVQINTPKKKVANSGAVSPQPKLPGRQPSSSGKVYHAVICHKTIVQHGTGVLRYDGHRSHSIAFDVAQFVGERPLSQDCNRFSFEIVAEGEDRNIAIGLCGSNYPPESHPGWIPGSVGYHADNGGIYLGAGTHSTLRKTCHQGDVMACEFDFRTLKAKFYKNDVLVYTTGQLGIPPEGFHPAVGMLSEGEAVRLLETEPWLPAKERQPKKRQSSSNETLFHSVICRGAQITHNTGILCYDGQAGTQSGQFVGLRPLDEDCNSFSFEIIDEGEDRNIAIGLCDSDYPRDSHPGWVSGSVGYHADNGGIYLGAGQHSTLRETCHLGDVMACEFDFRTHKAKFYKNDVLMYVTGKLRTPPGGFHPIVGMFSPGEAVCLLETEPWLP